MRRITGLIKEYISTTKRFGIIQWTIILCAVFCMTLVWPGRYFKVNYTSEAQCKNTEVSEPATTEQLIRQEFSPIGKKLNSISVYMENKAFSGDTMYVEFSLYDEGGRCLAYIVFDWGKVKVPGYVKVDVDLELNVGSKYYYEIGAMEGSVFLGYTNEENKAVENGSSLYKNVSASNRSLVTKYEYEREMGLKRILFLDAALLGGAIILIFIVGCIRERLLAGMNGEIERQIYWGKVEYAARFVMVGMSLAGVLLSFYGIVIKRVFTNDGLNIAVLFLSVVVAACLLNIKVFCLKSELAPLLSGEDSIWRKMGRWIRSLLLSAAVIMCCMYINGTSNYEKGLYLRLMLVFFGLFMVSTGRRKQIFHIPGLIWTLVAFGIGKYYIAQHNDHIEHINTANREAWLIWVIGLLIIHIIYRIKQGDCKKLRHFNISYALLMTAFFALCIVFANGKTWPAMVCVVFLTWSVIYLTADNREGIWEDVCNGILLAFFGGVIFCLYRRPYQYSMLERYSGIMFTVTSTALYYLVPAAAALTKTLIARKNGSKEKVWFCWSVFGIIAAYMAFTASRTGIASIIVMTFITLAFPWAGEKKGFIKRQFKSIGIMAITGVLMFITCFGATRMLPAMAGNPFYFFYEQNNAHITQETSWKGNAIKEQSYIEIQKVFQVLFDRVLGVSIGDDSAKIQNQDYVLGEMLASADPGAISKTEDVNAGYDNGRFAIYKTYFSQLNMTGHEEMSLMGEQGEEYIHAHNSYLQVAYDFGIPVGIVFLAFCLFTFILTLIKAWKQGSTSLYAFLPLLITAGFGVASLFEWVYHPCNPLGFAFLLILPFCLEKNKSVK